MKDEKQVSSQETAAAGSSVGPQTAGEDVAPDVREKLEHRYRELEQQYDQTRHQLQQFNERAVTFIRENPAVCIAGAVAAGYIVGRLASRRWLV